MAPSLSDSDGAFHTPDFFDRFVEVLNDVEPVEQNLRLRRMLFYQIGVGRPHVHTDDAQRLATPCAHFSGEKRFHQMYRGFRPPTPLATCCIQNPSPSIALLGWEPNFSQTPPAERVA